MGPTLRRVFFGLVIGTGLIVAVGVGPYFWIQSRQQAKWPTVQGRVLRADIEQGSTTRKNKQRFTAVVEYAYVVAGREWTSTTFTSTGNERFRDLDAARAFLAEYPVGSMLVVRYDESDPSRAVIRPSPPHVAWALMGIGCVFAVAGAVGLRRTKS